MLCENNKLKKLLKNLSNQKIQAATFYDDIIAAEINEVGPFHVFWLAHLEK